jgi:hypothetical protein
MSFSPTGFRTCDQLGSQAQVCQGVRAALTGDPGQVDTFFEFLAVSSIRFLLPPCERIGHGLELRDAQIW